MTFNYTLKFRFNPEEKEFHVFEAENENEAAVMARDCAFRRGMIVDAPCDKWGVPYTKSRVESLAREHVSFGWGAAPGSSTGGDVWPEEFIQAYMEAYNKAEKNG